MPRLRLIHWNAEEARSRLELLRKLGFEAVWEPLRSGAALRDFAQAPPDAFLVDLTRLPSHGRDVATALRARKATRFVPLVFVGGEPEKVERVRSVLPDAAYTDWEQVREAVIDAIDRRPDAPLTPSVMAAYEGRYTASKLGIRAGCEILLAGAPAGFAIEGIPESCSVRSRAKPGGAERVLLFVRSLKELERRFAAAGTCAKDGNGLWILWPKKSSGAQGDLTQAAVRKFGLAAGWVDYKICSVDATWSGLLFRRRG